ncbi:hypothetical protein C1896_07845 [Pseudomonadaceae bacterium SI-3]|nr:hypothetical protein C1896_07845 [Pseudomonadaceae bacterium SI-3]
MSEEKQISCAWCNELFTPHRKNHVTCSNNCCVKRYQQKQAIRSLLFKIKDPTQLAAMEVFAVALIDD